LTHSRAKIKDTIFVDREITTLTRENFKGKEWAEHLAELQNNCWNTKMKFYLEHLSETIFLKSNSKLQQKCLRMLFNLFSFKVSLPHPSQA
jgi:hypothetical protein